MILTNIIVLQKTLPYNNNIKFFTVVVMTKIVVASKNPVKINATLDAFKLVFPNEEFEVEGVVVPSGVSDQPMSEEETMIGAEQRVENAKNASPDADFWVGIEGGVQAFGNDLLAIAWVEIKSKDMVGRGRTGSFFLPTEIAKLVKQGKELGDADDIVFGKSNSKQQNGAIGLLTGNVITRTGAYSPAVVMALIPFKNKELYKKL